MRLSHNEISFLQRASNGMYQHKSELKSSIELVMGFRHQQG